MGRIPFSAHGFILHARSRKINWSKLPFHNSAHMGKVILHHKKFWNIWAPNMPGPELTRFFTNLGNILQKDGNDYRSSGSKNWGCRCVFLSTITADLMFIASLDCFWIAFRWQQSRARVGRHGKLTWHSTLCRQIYLTHNELGVPSLAGCHLRIWRQVPSMTQTNQPSHSMIFQECLICK